LPANLFTGAKHPAFSANHFVNTNKTKRTRTTQKKLKQSNKKTNNVPYAKAKANQTKARFRVPLCYPATK